jgi:hypothetical protein
MPLAIYFGAFNLALISSIKVYINYGLFLAAIIFFTTNDPGPLGFAHQIAPLYLIILMAPYMGRKFFIFAAAFAVTAIVSYMAIRSNLLNIGVAALIATSYATRRNSWTLPLAKKLRAVVLLSPLVFSAFGYFGYFNIFTIGDMFSSFVITDSRGGARNALVDSRTSIYNDVLMALTKKDAIIYGLGGYGKTETSLSDVFYADFDKIYIGGRAATESGMLNYFQWGGLIGVVIYFSLFVKASYLAMYKSRNWFCIMIGLWVAFKGAFSFIEDSLNFSPGTIFLFLAIGICLNRELRSMDDNQVKMFLRAGLFGGNSGRRLSVLKLLK